MYSRRSRLAAFTFTFRVAKTKALISCAFTAQLICVFVFAYADYWFSDAVAQFSCDLLTGLSYQENACLHIIRICFFIRIRFDTNQYRCEVQLDVSFIISIYKL